MKESWFIADPAEDPGSLPEQGWRQVDLPHQWTLEGIEAQAGWYRFEFPSALGRRWAEIRADYYADAWLHAEGRPADIYLGRHEGYFEPWLIEIPAEEMLFVRVSAPKEETGAVWPRYKRQIKGVLSQHDCRPGGSTARGQERGTGGLWGGLRYFRTGPLALLHLSWRAIKISSGWKLWIDLEIDAEPALWAEAAILRAATQSRSPTRRESVELGLLPANFQGESYTSQHELDLLPGRRTYTLVWDLPELPRWEVWERGFPHLYELSVRLASAQPAEQSISSHVGFRSISQEGDWLVLNGARLFLRGTNIIPTQWLAGYNGESARRDVQLVREAHLNAVRVHAHLTHPAFYHSCDRQGILVWQDFPMQWGYATDETFAQEAVRQARAMVSVFGNHPSIYLWCAHNEPTHNRFTLDPLLAAALKHADSTRLIKEASDFREHPYPGWYWGSLRDFLAVPGAPLPSEFGAQALPRAELLQQVLGEAAWPPNWDGWVYHNFQPDQTFRVANIDMGDSLEEFVANSQLYQANLIKFAIEAFRRAKGNVTGFFQFMFVDPWEAITWSVLDSQREPKLGYFALKEASAPVMLSFVPFRDNLEAGQPPFSEAWIINDLSRSLKLKVDFRLEGDEIIPLFEQEHQVEAQSAQCIFHIGEFYESSTQAEDSIAFANRLKSITPGEYRLVGEAWEGQTLLSRNELNLSYLEPFVQLGEGW